MNRKFASVRLIAADMKAMVAFYELVTEQTADWLAPQFAEIVTPAATLAIGSADSVAAFAQSTAEPGANGTAILEFMVDDSDAAFDWLNDKAELVHEPKPLPWGNRTFQVRDPEGFAVGLFLPFTDAAKARFGLRKTSSHPGSRNENAGRPAQLSSLCAIVPIRMTHDDTD